MKRIIMFLLVVPALLLCASDTKPIATPKQPQVSCININYADGKQAAQIDIPEEATVEVKPVINSRGNGINRGSLTIKIVFPGQPPIVIFADEAQFDYRTPK